MHKRVRRSSRMCRQTFYTIFRYLINTIDARMRDISLQTQTNTYTHILPLTLF